MLHQILTSDKVSYFIIPLYNNDDVSNGDCSGGEVDGMGSSH